MLKKTLLAPTQTIGNFELWSVFSKIKKETFIVDEDNMRLTVGYKIKQDSDYNHKIMLTLHIAHNGSPYSLEDIEAFEYLKLKKKQQLAFNLFTEAQEVMDHALATPYKEQVSDDFADLLDFEVCEDTEETEQPEDTEETKAQNLLSALRAALR